MPPYEYRTLSADEREEILRARREQGSPLHAPPHPYRHEAWYLITAANFEHTAIMSAPTRRTEFEHRLLSAMAEIKADVAGWVVLPNHYHIVLYADSLDLISGTLKLLHGRTAHDWNRDDGLTGGRRVWYHFSDQVMRDEDHFYRALNYVHINPVKHGYVQDPYEWPWSSVHDYYQTQGRNWLRENWRTHHPGDFGRGWDD
ncbi:MAG: transposase [Anaerolineae bacterium]